MRKLIASLVLAMGGLWLLAGSASAQENQTPSQIKTETETKPVEHIVQAGEYLSMIAEQHRMDSWVPIWNANAQLEHPDVVNIGEKLTIPTGETVERPLPAQVTAPPIAKRQTPNVKRQASSANYAPGTGGAFAAIRQCESGGNYATNTGNGYYGAYQYDIRTWNNYQGYPRADLAPPAVQDAKAAETQARRGWSPWPACSRRLGLN